MKKVGIVTFHNALSYGAALQSYALQQFLLKNGVDNDIIDYQCDYIDNKYKKLISVDGRNALKSLAGSLLRAGNKRKSLELSAEFRNKYMKLSKSCNRGNISQLADEYAAFICGSDQVWSPTCAGFDKTYLLDFAEKGQKYSYAASFGRKDLPEDKIGEYKRLLSDFENLSAREQSGAELAQTLTGKTAQVNIDPTLLLTRADWDKIAVTPEVNQPYILLFNVLKPVNLCDYAVDLGKEKRLPVYHLNDMHFPKRQGISYLEPTGAAEFVGLIKNAEYVVTNSFHCGVFALIYRKKFVMELNSATKRNIRSEELLKALGVEHREIAKGSKPQPDEPIDFDRAETVLDDERLKSKKLILKIKDDIQSRVILWS